MNTATTITHELIHEWFTEIASLNPIAVAIEIGERRVTYGELQERSNSLANYLISKGAGQGTIVGILTEDTSELIVGILGTLKAGAAFMPLDVRQPGARLRKLLELAPPEFLLTEAAALGELEQVHRRKPLKVMCMDASATQAATMLAPAAAVAGPGANGSKQPGAATAMEVLADYQDYHNPAAPGVSSDPDQLSYIYFTSGSTGTPKAIAGRLSAIAHFINWEIEELGVGAGVRVSQLLSPSFDGSLRDVFLPLCVGGVVCVPERREQVLGGRGLAEWLEEARIEVMHCVPSVFRALVNEEMREQELGALRYVVMAGEALVGRDVKKWKQVYGERVGLLNLYGTSETTMAKFSYRVGVGDEEREVMPIGKPIPGALALILNQRAEPCKRGMVGEIYIRTPYRSLGYYQQPELTAEVFVPNPFSTDPTDLVHKTGDMGRVLEDGNYEYLGRRDEQVKVRGARVELKEVENAVRGQAGVLDVAVIEREDASGFTYLCAYLVLAEGVQTGAVAEGLEHELPDYMVPSAYVKMDELPRTISGKVDRRALPEMGASEGGAEYVGARTPVEELLVESWGRLLGRERIGIDDNFFRLGGHSLLATQVMSRVRDSFGVEVGLRVLFEHPTVRGLAEVIEEKLRGGEELAAPAIGKVSRAGELELSFAQQRLWFLDQLEPGSNAYNIPAAVRLQGELNTQALEQSFREVIRRHESLRTRFGVIDGKPVQLIDEAPEFSLAVLDLSAVAEADREAEARRVATEEAQRPFDLSAGPLLRASVLRLSEQEHVLLCTMHHIISDGWSMGVFIGELTTLYEAYATGQESPLPELDIQYADFAHWQREWLQGQVLDGQLSYWKEQLAGAPAVLELPTDYPRPAVQTFRGAHQSTLLSEKLSKQLGELSQRAGVTLFMTVLAAFQSLLSRYSGQEEIVIGTPIAGRNRAETESLIGFFVNTLVLRTDLGGNPTFEEVLGRVKEVALGAYAHQDVPFELLVEELQPERDMSRTPLFQVMMVFQNAPAVDVEIKADLQLGSIGVENQTAKFDLTLSVSETGSERLQCVWEYNTDLFADATIERMIKHFEVLLDGVANNPECQISELSLLSGEERGLILLKGNRAAEYPQEKCIHRLFEEQVERTPEAVAVVFEEERITYRELNERANRLANYLQSVGVGAESLVGICVARSTEMVVGLLGILKAGGAYVPLDPAYPQERLSFMIEDAKVSLLLTQQILLDSLPPLAVQILCLDSDWPLVVADQPAGNPPALATTDNLAYVIYTSGSTGQPKGVLITHGNVGRLFAATNADFNFTEDDVWTLFHSFAFDFSVWELWGALLYGGRLVVVPFWVSRSPEEFSQLLISQGVTVLNQTPSAFRQLAPAVAQATLNATESQALRLIIFGGEALELRSLAPWMANYGDEQPRLINMYGITETTVHVTQRRARLADGERAGSLIGGPLSDLAFYILDRGMEPAPLGVNGEVYVGGAGVGRGYLNRSGLTAERFVPDPFSAEAGARLYRSGDVARYLDNGEVEYVGRADSQVKVRGYRVELGELREKLNEHVEVTDSVVVLAGEGAEAMLVGYYVSPHELPVGELRAWLRERVIEETIPNIFVHLDAMPLTVNGKINYSALPAINETRERIGNGELAHTPIEEILSSVWSYLLRLDSVGIHDNFFDLGGHSLLATQLVSRIRLAFNLELPLRCLFEHPTVSALALLIESQLRSGQSQPAPAILPVPRDVALPLSFAQQRLWFADQLEPGSSLYNIPAAVRLQGTLDISALEQSFQEVVRRHESLRTRFGVIDGKPVQIIDESPDFSVAILDLRTVAEADREAEARRVGAAELQRPFDFSAGPLLRAMVLRLTEQEHVLLFTMHHIISDGWSMGVLIRELTTLYEAYSTGQESPLPKLEIQYADFAHWQREWLQGDVLERQLNYWKEQLSGAPAVLELPTDYPRPAVQSFRGAHQSMSFPADLTSGLKALTRASGVTLFMTLLAAFQSLLSRYSGQDDIVVSTGIANRNRAETENLIGFFVNTLVLRTDLSGEPSFTELVKRVREVTLGAYAHQDVPFELLVEVLAPVRDPRYTPLFQVMLLLQNARVEEGVELKGLQVSGVGGESGTAKFDLALIVEERGEELGMVLEYNTDLFAAGTIEKMLVNFRTLVEGIVAEPERSIGSLPMMDAQERQRLTGPGDLESLVSLGTDGEIAEVSSVEEMFDAAAARYATDSAIEIGERRVSYGELQERSNSLANYLISKGAGRGSIVGILTADMCETIVGMLGTLKAGAAFMPLDVRQPAARLRKLMELAPPEFLLTEAAALAGLGQVQRSEPLKVMCIDASATQAANLLAQAAVAGPRANGSEQPDAATMEVLADYLDYRNPAAPGVSSDPDQLSYIYFTSGSTGTPKAIAGRLRGMAHFINWEIGELRVEAGVRVSQLLSPSFDGSLRDVFLPLCVGGVVCIPERREQVLEGRGLVEWLEETRVEVMHCVPSVFRALVNEEMREQELGALQYVVMAGEALVGRDVKRWKQVYGERVGLVNLYGTSETTMAKFSYRVGAGDEEREVMPIGKPIAGAEAYLLDERGEPCGRGMVGEIYIRTPYRSLGYYRQPDLTAAVFVSNPFSTDPADLVHKTGDMGRLLEDGNYEYLGRRDEQVKVRGARVELKEVENAVRGQAGVLDVAVIEREDTSGYTYLCAYLVLAEGVQTGAVAEGLEQELPDYMVPSAYVKMEELPRTISGKVDRRALPEIGARDGGADYVPARTQVEELLVESWARLLGIERVGIEDNFFRLGGHSLLATQVMSRVRESFGVEIGLRVLFEHPTVRGLGEIIEEQLRGGEELAAPAIGKVSRAGDLMLSFAQQRMWFLDQLEPGSSAYNMGAAVRLQGTVDIRAMERSFGEVMRRHESLRTRFGVVNGVPVQVIDEAPEFRLTVQDLSGVAEAEREAEAQRVGTEEAQRPFDLAAGPLLRAMVLRMSEEEHVLLCTMHHIISDGWSMGVLIRELTTLYEAYATGEESPLPELGIQYADFAHWQREWLQGEVLERQINYWREELAGAAPVIDLPTDQPRPAVQSSRGASHAIALSRELADGLKELSRREGVTLFMTLLAGFQTLLNRYTEQTDVVVGSPIANRTRGETEELIGFFVNTMVLRTDLSGDPSFVELLGRVREVALGAYAHQDVPFEKLVEELRLERDLRYSPLFQVMFVFQPPQNSSSGGPKVPSLSASAMGVKRMGAEVDLNLSLFESARGVDGVLEYRTDLFDADTIEYLAGVYVELLEKAVAQPEITLSQIELPEQLQAKVRAARAREQKQKIAIAATFTAEPLEESLKFWMEELDLPSDIEFATYNQVFQQLLDPASLLRKNQHGVNVALVRFEDWVRYLEDENSLVKIEGYVRDLLDALRAARERQSAATPYIVCVCPPSPLEVEDAERTALFQRMEELMATELNSLNGLYFVSSSELMAAYPVEKYYDATTDELGHVPFTPLFFTALGTTIGRKLQSLRSAPYKVIVLDCDQTLWKGVCAEDGALGIEIDSARREFQEFMVAQHDAGMLLCLCSKNQEEDVIEVFEKRPEMPLQRSHLASYRINWRPKSENIMALAEELGLGLDSFIFVDNDPLECAEVQARCPEVLTLELPQEQGSITRFLRHVWAFDHLDVTAEDKQRTTLYQQNMERERFRRESFNLEEFLSELDLKIEIAEAGPEHWGRVAQLTQRTNQFNTTTIRRTEAEIEHLCVQGGGRCLVVKVEDRFGKYGLVGVMLYTAAGDEAIQVESLLLSCRVLGRGVEQRMLIELGKAAAELGRNRVDVYYEESEKNEPALNALEAVAGGYKEQDGAGYVFRIPVEVALTPVDSETVATQVDIQSLKQETAYGLQRQAVEVRAKSALVSRIATTFYDPEQILKAIELEKQTARSEAAGVYIAPRTPVEEILAEIWVAVLGISQVGVNDNFFTLGGHSLLGTVMISRVRDALRVELPLLSLFESPTVAGLSEIVEEQLRGGEELAAPAIGKVSRAGDLMLSFAQQRMWFLDQLEPGSSAYNMGAAVRLQGTVDIRAMERSFGEVMRRHESLRTRFGVVNGVPVQVIDEAPEFRLTVQDLSGVAEAEREAEAQRVGTEEAQRPFDLAAGPLLRAMVLRMSEEEHVLLCTMHHIISDGWSMGVLIRELTTLYEAYATGEQSPLPELGIQYADFAHWQREWLQGEVLERQINYWREELAGAAPVIDLPTDQPRPAVQSSRGASHTIALSRELADGLKELSRREGVTLFMTLLAGFQTLLNRYTEQTDVVVGSPIANRTRGETEELIGFFVNTMVLRTDLSGDPSFVELLGRVREVALGAYAHQDVPFEKLVEELRLERDLRYSPLFQVMFVFQPPQNSSSGGPKVPSLSASAMGVKRVGAEVDLNLSLFESARGVDGVLEYRTDLFDADTIEYLAGVYVELLEKAVAQPEITLSQIELPEQLQAKVRAARAREQKQKIAIAATFTAEPLEESLKFWMEELDLPSDIEFATYNQVFQQLLDPASLLRKNQHGVNVALVRFEDWVRYLEDESLEIAARPKDQSSIARKLTADSLVKIESYVRDLLDALRAAREGQSAATPYIVCVCPPSPLEVEDAERTAFFQRMEELMATELNSLNGLYFVSSAELMAAYPVEKYYDATTDELGHVPFTPLFFTALGTTIGRKLQSLRSAPYKVIVLDCDQTLWKGVCAEDGALGIEIDTARREFQEFMVAQHDAGMLLCLCSKNQEEDVIEVFEKRPEMPLQRSHLASYRINWRPKSENIMALAEELGLGLDSFIFVDNDPLECAEVQARCPEVLTLELPQEQGSITRFLRHVWAFDHLDVTAEDKQRTTLYQQNMERERFRRESFNLEEFLSELDLKVEIAEAGPEHWGRVAQLTQRTNQFNTTTIRRTEAEIEHLCVQGGGRCLVVKVEDRFGKYGLVGVMLYTAAGDEAIQVESLLLSCRVLGRGVEQRMLIELGKAAAELGRNRVDVYYEESEKNEPALNALEAVAGGYKEQDGAGYVFRIPVEVALTPVDSETVATQVDIQSLKQETATGLQRQAVEVRAKSALVSRIATTFYDPEQILKAIELEKQTARSEAAGVYVAPRTPVEEILAEIWVAVLGISQVGVNDNFFTLGGHSLLGTVMISRVRDALRVELPLLSLFESPTVAGLSEIVERSLIEQVDADQMTEMLRGLEDLSEEEISSLLITEAAQLD